MAINSSQQGGQKKDMRMNEQIRVPEVRLLGEEGEQFGIVGIGDALARARQSELDLVEISPTAQPPVCRIMDYGKYKYQQAKKEAQQRKKQQGGELKQLRIKTYRIDPHDVAIKRRKAREFLEDGNRLLITMMFRARENSHADLGERILSEQFGKPLADVAKVDSSPRKEGRKMTMTLAPLPNLKQILAARAKEEAKKKAEDAARLAEEKAQADLAKMATELPPAGDELDDDEDDGDDGEE